VKKELDFLFEKLRMATNGLVMFLCLYVRPSVIMEKTQVPLDGFS